VHVLVVEDDPAVATLVRRGLMMEGHDVDVATRGAEGLEQATTGQYDALILDLTLPDTDGLRVAARLREDGVTIPILMLTGRDDLQDRLGGFAAGADDYLTKPFAVQELLARLRAVTRRASTAAQEDRLEVADLVLDRRAHEVYRGGRQLQLTPKEYSVLEALMERPGQVLSRDLLLDRVWGYDSESVSNVVDTTIRRLRQAVDSVERRPLIQTVRGVGYKISP
jgi:DNA-binding response OmpR family regulator